MVIATFSTGIDSQCFRFKKDVCSEGEEEDGVPYGCGFFHFVFATVAMQLIGWNTHHPMIKQIFFNILIHTSVSTGLRLLRILTFFWFRWMIDVGWTSTWWGLWTSGLRFAYTNNWDERQLEWTSLKLQDWETVFSILLMTCYDSKDANHVEVQKTKSKWDMSFRLYPLYIKREVILMRSGNVSLISEVSKKLL